MHLARKKGQSIAEKLVKAVMLNNRHAELDSASLVHHEILSQAQDDGIIVNRGTIPIDTVKLD